MTGKDRYTEDRQQLKANYSNNQCIIEKFEKRKRNKRGENEKRKRNKRDKNEKRKRNKWGKRKESVV